MPFKICRQHKNQRLRTIPIDDYKENYGQNVMANVLVVAVPVPSVSSGS